MSTAYAKTAPRVLVVDDDPIQLEFLRRVLERCVPRPAVTIAHSGPEAMQLLRDAAWDLVVADYKMPRFSGARVVNAAKRGGADAYLVSCDPGTASSAEIRESAHPKIDLPRLVPEWLKRVADKADDDGSRGPSRGDGKGRGFRAKMRRTNKDGLSAARAFGRAIKTVVLATHIEPGHHAQAERA